MPEGSQQFQVGSVTCTVLSDGYAAYPASWFFPDAEPARLAAGLESRGASQERVLSPYTCLLIQTGRRTILVDTGAGAATPTSGAIQPRLERFGIRPDDVDMVVITHAHPDHIGGAVDARGYPLFPNACHFVSELEQEFWMKSRPDLSGMRLPSEVTTAIQATARRCLAALRFQIELVEHEMEIAPGIRVIPAPGHTPGHMALLIASNGEALLNLTDAAVHPLHLEELEWRNGFDLTPDLALDTRRSLLRRAAAGKMHVMGFHFPFPSIGRIAENGPGWKWSPGW